MERCNKCKAPKQIRVSLFGNERCRVCGNSFSDFATRFMESFIAFFAFTLLIVSVIITFSLIGV